MRHSLFSPQQLPHLTTFAELVRQRSFTRAARVLGVSKSFVSTQVRALEESLGLRLVERTTRSFALTQAGERVLVLADRVLAAAEEVAMTAETYRSSVSGTLRVGAPHELGWRIVAPVLAGLCNAHPGLNVDLLCDDAPVDGAKTQIDAAVRTGVLREPAVGRPVAVGSEIIVAAPRLAEQYQHATSPVALANAPWIHHKAVDPTLRQTFTNAERTETLPRPVVRASANTTEGMVHLLMGGVGFCVLPQFNVQDAILQGKLVHVLPTWKRRTIGVYVLMPSIKQRPRRVTIFVDALRAAFSKLGFPSD